MVAEIEIHGADQLHKAYRDLREVGEKRLRVGLTKAIREATAPTKALIKEHQLSLLPKKGGLAARVAGSKITNRVRTSARDPGVALTITSDYDVKAIDRGKVRHPVFAKEGKRKRWVLQKVPPGTITEPINETKARVQEQIIVELKRIESFLNR